MEDLLARSGRGRDTAQLQLVEFQQLNFWPEDGPPLEFSSVGRCLVEFQADPLAAVAEARFRFDLPRSLARDRKSRDPKTTPCDVTVRLTLRAGARRLDVATEFNNRAFDHRLRA